MVERENVALAYVESHNVMTLATSSDDGPWAAAVFYASFAFTFYFLSSADSRHARHIAATGRCAATIQDDVDDWTAIKGIQLEGRVQRQEGSDRDHAIMRYTAKFPFLKNPPPPIARALEKVAWFRLTPDHLYFVDNSRGFGHRTKIV